MKKLLLFCILCIGCESRFEGKDKDKLEYQITQYADNGNIINQYIVIGYYEWYWGNDHLYFYVNDRYFALTGNIQIKELSQKVEEIE